MNKEEINSLIKSNKNIEKAYKSFKRQILLYEIVDMYEILHMEKPIIEVYIKFININGLLQKFCYLEDEYSGNSYSMVTYI